MPGDEARRKKKIAKLNKRRRKVFLLQRRNRKIEFVEAKLSDFSGIQLHISSYSNGEEKVCCEWELEDDSDSLAGSLAG